MDEKFLLLKQSILNLKKILNYEALEGFNSENVTVERGSTKRSVVVYDKITPTNCMSQLYMICTIE